MRILFFGEAVTLAHVARPYVLASALDSGCHEIHFATSPAYRWLLKESACRFHELDCQPTAHFLAAILRGRPVVDADTLARHVRSDLALIERVQPDLIIGDFRLSLAVSAPLARVPYAALVNAHWSPYARLPHWPVPENPLTHRLGVGLAQKAFDHLRPLIFKAHCRPMNSLRRRYGLPVLPNLQSVYTQADHTLYVDAPGFVPTVGKLPPQHHFLGPVLWSPPVPPPPWWGKWARDRRTVYVTLGSSGQTDALPAVLQGLARLDANILLATAGRRQEIDLPKSCYVAEYLPGELAAQAADLVVCNGGSATVYQALAAGRPVLGLASNMDQQMTMALTEWHGAGQALRPERLRPAAVTDAAGHLLVDSGARAAARRLAELFARHDARAAFLAWFARLSG